jgi:hypothetical protein
MISPRLGLLAVCGAAACWGCLGLSYAFAVGAASIAVAIKAAKTGFMNSSFTDWQFGSLVPNPQMIFS